MMDTPKDRANDPKRKATHDYTDDELLEKFNELHARLTAKTYKNKFEWDTRDGQSFDADGNRLDVPSRSWSLPPDAK